MALIFKILNSGDFLATADINKDTSSTSIIKDISQKALRYDLTIPFARYVASNRNEIVFPFRRYQMQNVWRADRPQKGRYREFFQSDVDIIGTSSLLSEIELLQLCDEIYSSLGIPDIQISINNRKILNGMVEIMDAEDSFSDIVIALDKLQKIGLSKVKDEMRSKGVSDQSITILDKFLNVKNLSELSNLISSSKIGQEGVSELEFIFQNINKLDINSSLIFDVSLARGIEYYTGSIIEVRQMDINVGSIAGGGRYDNLTSMFGLDNISGVGISFGVDRIYLVMQELDLFPVDIDVKTRVMLANFGEKEALFSLSILKELRDNGISSILYPSSDKIKRQMSYANKKGIEFVLMVGEDEMNNGNVAVKNMISGTQVNMNITEFIKGIL